MFVCFFKRFNHNTTTVCALNEWEWCSFTPTAVAFFCCSALLIVVFRHIVGAEGEDKIERVRSYGADEVIDYGRNALEVLGEMSVDIIIDNVAGENFVNNLKLLKRGGRYASSGAIAGPIVELDFRTMYLRDLTLVGCTGWDEPVFPSVIEAIEKGEIKPALSKTFPLSDIVEAQKELVSRKHVGKLVLIPNHED